MFKLGDAHYKPFHGGSSYVNKFMEWAHPSPYITLNRVKWEMRGCTLFFSLFLVKTLIAVTLKPPKCGVSHNNKYIININKEIIVNLTSLSHESYIMRLGYFITRKCDKTTSLLCAVIPSLTGTIPKGTWYTERNDNSVICFASLVNYRTFFKTTKRFPGSKLLPYTGDPFFEVVWCQEVTKVSNW